MSPAPPPPRLGNILSQHSPQRKHEQPPARAARRRAARAAAKEAERRRAARELTARKIATLPAEIQRSVRRGYGARILEEITFLSACAMRNGAAFTEHSREYIANKADCCTKTVSRWTKKYTELGLLKSVQRPPLGWNRWQSNITILSEHLARWTRNIYRNMKVSHYPGDTEKSGDSGTLPPAPTPKKAPPGDFSPRKQRPPPMQSLLDTWMQRGLAART